MSNREKLKLKAIELFYEKGYSNVGVQEIVDSCNLTKPTLYHYFGSKKGLFDSIFQDVVLEDFNKISQAGEYSGDFINSLERMTYCLSDCFFEEQLVYCILFRLTLSGNECEDYLIAHKYLERLYNIILTLFINAKDQLGNMNGRQDQFTHSYFAVVVDFLFRNKDKKVSHEQIYQLLRQYQFGIYS